MVLSPSGPDLRFAFSSILRSSQCRMWWQLVFILVTNNRFLIEHIPYQTQNTDEETDLWNGFVPAETKVSLQQMLINP